MSETYVECMVASKPSTLQLALKYLLIGLMVVIAFLFLITGSAIIFLVAVLDGVGIYFASMYANVEYEYLYLDKEIVVDKVLNKQKRKRFATYELEKIEIFAPIKSYHLDGYKNRQAQVVDISSKVEKQPDLRYVFFYNGEQKVIIEPNEALVKVLKNVAPRKVFTD